MMRSLTVKDVYFIIKICINWKILGLFVEMMRIINVSLFSLLKLGQIIYLTSLYAVTERFFKSDELRWYTG